jgi:putative tryptophan/tyrosine transport system substrate-binding protein
MRRRDFITLLGGAAAALPDAVHAQEPVKMLRVGVVSGQPRNSSFWQPFKERMTELGYHDGKNFVFDFITAQKIDEYDPAYRELVTRHADILLAPGPEIALKSALANSTTTPIVMVAIDYDPLAHGYVTSLARPAGNVTGVFLQQIELTEKRLQLLKSAFPDLQAATVFWDWQSTDQWEAAQRAAAALRLQLSGVEILGLPFDYEKALAQSGAGLSRNFFCIGLLIPFSRPCATSRLRATQSDFDDVRLAPVGRRGRLDVLWGQRFRHAAACRKICRSYRARGQTRRFANRATHQI